ncbi:hypothetical protein ACFYOF_37965 [Streptomyces sp. NPDC007148]|uniref:hypothetical protein n=1 Tax=Streptomyces sp. NPDC007148 TaxID=3364775 RepID=UPI0036A8782D
MTDRGQTRSPESGETTARRADADRGPLPERDRLFQVHGDVVGEQGHGEVGQFLAGLHHVQGAAQTRTGPVENGEALTRLPTRGDVGADDAHPERFAVGALEALERHRERLLGALARRQPRPVLVDLGRTVLEDLPHHRLDRFGIGTGQDVGERRGPGGGA